MANENDDLNTGKIENEGEVNDLTNENKNSLNPKTETNSEDPPENVTNDTETQESKTHINNIEWQFANHELGNFVQINKEIIFKKDSNGKYCVSLGAKGLFFTLMCLQGIDWHLTQAGLATLCCCTTKKIKHYLKELTELGYFKNLGLNPKNKGKFAGITYKVFETTNPELWDTNANEKTGKKPYVKKAHAIKSHSKKVKQYNNKKNKYSKDKINKNNEFLLNKFIGKS